MDYIDEEQLTHEQGTKRLMDESVSIEQSRGLNQQTAHFNDKLVTEKQIIDEMMHTKIMCMPCKRKDA